MESRPAGQPSGDPRLLNAATGESSAKLMAAPQSSSPPKLTGAPTATPASRPPWRTVIARLLAILAKVAIVLLALIGLLSMLRGTPVSRVRALGREPQVAGVRDSAFPRLMQLYTGTSLTGGNRIEVLSDGDGTYPRLWRDLGAAARSITAQFYYSKPGAVADTLAASLSSAARRGVAVRLLLDAFGSQNLTKGWTDSLGAAGVSVAFLRPLRWYALDRVTNRSHVRAVVVDGMVGYTGGFGLGDYWLGRGHADGEWRETNVRLTGPEVPQLQAAFTAAWAEATGELLTGDLLFPPATFAPAGPHRAALMYTQPTIGSTPGERFLALTVSSARKTLYITNSYFLPDDDFRRFLVDAVRRGVDVRVLTASTKTDIKSVYYASHARYEELLAGGVRIFEYQPTMMHSKTIVADGYWSAIGSMNFDNRSIALNDEANIVTLDAAVGATMDSLFLDDLEYSREITLDAFQRRPQWQRVLEWGANLLSPVL